MREIKFRAWYKSMRYSDRYKPISDFFAVHVDAGDEKIMQFTGLLDKNGKEIYEGDIVQRGIIVFHNGKFQGNYYESGGGLAETWEDDLYNERGIEVLGNIHENPELLK